MEKRVIICRCEEVTKEEIIASIRQGSRSVVAVKRRTGTGMGLCRGISCQRLIAQLLYKEAGVPLEDSMVMRVRPPVRLLPMHAPGK